MQKFVLVLPLVIKFVIPQAFVLAVLRPPGDMRV
jgi:hypothetical protein